MTATTALSTVGAVKPNKPLERPGTLARADVSAASAGRSAPIR
jgi:hypothetical protein